MNDHFQDLLSDILEKNNLQESNLLNLLPTAVYICDASGIILTYNEACINLWGRKPEIGRELWCGSWKMYDINGGPLHGSHCPMAVAVKEGRAVSGTEIIIERPDGTRRRIAPNPRPVFTKSGTLIGAVNVLLDVTDIREKEQSLEELTSTLEKKIIERTSDLQRKNEELQRSEQRHHKMVEEVQDYAILLLDRDGTVLNWNRGAERIKGYKEDEIVGKNFRLFYRENDRKSGLPEKLINQAVTEGRAVHEGPRVRKDGTQFWGSITITALHNDKGAVIGFSKVTRDLTDKKLAEDKIKKYMEDLEFQNKELEQFAYAAAHDMKEPLRKILVYNNYINDTSSHLLGQKQQDYLHRSIDSASRMQRLIDDLLTYSKTSWRTETHEAVCLNDIIQEVLISQRDSVKQCQAKVNVKDLPVIEGVPFQLRQLFDNLIANSLKYQDPSRKCIIEIGHHMLKAPNAIEGLDPLISYHAIFVKDNGIGFETKYKDQLFSLFKRLHTDKQYQGTGIGLAICKKIMQNHRGNIAAEGEPGKGATFTLYFPVRDTH